MASTWVTNQLLEVNYLYLIVFRKISLVLVSSFIFTFLVPCLQFCSHSEHDLLWVFCDPTFLCRSFSSAFFVNGMFWSTNSPASECLMHQLSRSPLQCCLAALSRSLLSVVWLYPRLWCPMLVRRRKNPIGTRKTCFDQETWSWGNLCYWERDEFWWMVCSADWLVGLPLHRVAWRLGTRIQNRHLQTDW